MGSGQEWELGAPQVMSRAIVSRHAAGVTTLPIDSRWERGHAAPQGREARALQVEPGLRAGPGSHRDRRHTDFTARSDTTSGTNVHGITRTRCTRSRRDKLMPSILVVDDNEQLRTMVRRMLEARGHAVTTADPVRSARRRRHGRTPDVVEALLGGGVGPGHRGGARR